MLSWCYLNLRSHQPQSMARLSYVNLLIRSDVMSAYKSHVAPSICVTFEKYIHRKTSCIFDYLCFKIPSPHCPFCVVDHHDFISTSVDMSEEDDSHSHLWCPHHIWLCQNVLSSLVFHSFTGVVTGYLWAWLIHCLPRRSVYTWLVPGWSPGMPLCCHSLSLMPSGDVCKGHHLYHDVYHTLLKSLIM